MASHLRCLLFHGNGDFRGRVLSAIGRMLKTHSAVSGGKGTYYYYHKKFTSNNRNNRIVSIKLKNIRRILDLFIQQKYEM